MALFPPGKGGGEGVARGYKGKGVLLHGLCEGNGRLLSLRVTPANGDERAQVLPLIDAVVLAPIEDQPQTLKPQAVKNLAGDKGYDSKPL